LDRYAFGRRFRSRRPTIIERLQDVEFPGLQPAEVVAMQTRANRLLNFGIEAPDGTWPAVPWPVF